jgi:hypothetical protein
MGIELIVEKYKNDLPGYTLVGYGEVGFPQYKTKLLCLMLKDKRLPVIDEYVLRLYKENVFIEDMGHLLGIDQDLVESSWFNLIHLGLIHLETKWITEKGYSYLREHKIESNEKKHLNIAIDGLSGEVKKSRMFINRKTVRETNLEVINGLIPQPSEYNLKVSQLKRVLSEYQSREPDNYTGTLLDIIEVDNKPTQFKRLNILIFSNSNGDYRFMVCDDAQSYDEYESLLISLEESGTPVLNYRIGKYFENNDLIFNQKLEKGSKNYLSPLEIRNYTLDILRNSELNLYISLPLVKAKTPDDFFIDRVKKKVKEKVNVFLLVSGREFIDNYQKSQYEKLINIKKKYKNLIIVNIPLFQISAVVSENQGIVSYFMKHEIKAPTSKFGITETGFVLNPNGFSVLVNEKFTSNKDSKREFELISRSDLKNKLFKIVQLVSDFDEYLLNKNNIGWIGGEAVPDLQRLLESPVATTENNFKVFMSSIHTSLGESLEKNGKVHGQKSYFWSYFKDTFPEIHKVLHKIRIYRHSTEHISLEEKPKESYFRFLDEDIDGAIPLLKEDGYRILQTKLLFELEEALERVLLVKNSN